ncbi:MAG: hypothetical protein QGH91_05600 [Candidatus Marinimicrobia bacterium]|nr:hypothetical protein [Candidatus Neomarinimicrobiota bacterium]MDP7437268.1 hypothetical protein [Candidatus Neomarinimicrobiota bacterium]|tara:strand:+ start:208 stop:2271 length:2064 start_codon:yes stop_codon:yes gene_type:complete
MRKIFRLLLVVFLLPLILVGQSMRDLEYQVVKLSYVEVDRALAILKTVGYTVVEFKSGKGELAGEYSFTPSVSSTLSIKEFPKKDVLPIIIKVPDTETVSLLTQEKGKSAKGKKTELGLDLAGIPMLGATAGAPQQQILIGYNPNDFEPVARLLDLLSNKIDIPAAQIQIEALVIELDSDKLNSLGIDFGGAQGGLAGEFPPPNPSTGALNPFTLVFDRTVLGTATDFNANIQALISISAAEILSRPSVLTLDGRQARIQVGQQIPIVKTTSTQTAVSKSVDYIPVGIVLNLRPRVSEDQTRITIQIETIITETEERTGALAATSGVQEAPLINNRKVQSFVRVANNTPFIVGGLISRKVSDVKGGVPLLSSIPLLGRLFSSSTVETERKEVIVVITPHIISEQGSNFSRVIPLDSEIFNAFGNQLFQNSYRVQNADVYDLSFVNESPVFTKMIEDVAVAAEINKTLKVTQPYKGLLEGEIPGEEILVRRMLYDIIERNEYYKYISPEKVIFFKQAPDDPAGFEVNGLEGYIKDIAKRNALKLSYSVHEKASMEKPFVRPTADLEYIPFGKSFNYKGELEKTNIHGATPEEDIFTIIIKEQKHERRLYEVLILKKVLEINPDLKLSVTSFQPGIEILFPAPEVLEKNSHVVDRDVARYFYEVNNYYGMFEKEFNRKTAAVGKMLINR